MIENVLRLMQQSAFHRAYTVDNSRAANAERDKADQNSNDGIYTDWDKTKIDENEWLGDDIAKGLLSPSVKALFSFFVGTQREKNRNDLLEEQDGKFFRLMFGSDEAEEM